MYYPLFPLIAGTFQLKYSALVMRSSPVGTAVQISSCVKGQGTPWTDKVRRIAKTVEHLYFPHAPRWGELKYRAGVGRSAAGGGPVKIAGGVENQITLRPFTVGQLEVIDNGVAPLTTRPVGELENGAAALFSASIGAAEVGSSVKIAVRVSNQPSSGAISRAGEVMENFVLISRSGTAHQYLRLHR